MGAPFTTTRGYVRERVLEELYRRPGEYLSTQQLTALIDEADTSAEIASICFDLKRTQRLCTGQKVMGANGIPANTWGLSAGERADLERRRPDLAALAAPKGKGQASGAKAKVKGNGRGHDPALAKGAKGKAAKGAEAEVAGVKQGLTTAGSATPADPATPATPPTPAPAVVLAAADLDALGLPAAAPGDDPLPLPTESHEDERPLPAPAKTGCGGHGTYGGHCANHERDSLRQQLDEQETRLSDLAHAEAAAVELESDLAAAREEVEITRAALREARENLKQVREDLGAQLDGRNTLVADQGLRIDDLLKQVYDRDTLIKVHSERIDDLIGQRVKLLDDLKAKDGALKAALTEIAALESFRDSFLGILEERDARLAEAQREQDRLHQRLREQERQRAEDQNRIDALMDVARPHLAKGKHGDTARAAAPFGLPVIPKDWIGLLKLTLLDDNAKLVLKIDNEGGGAYATLKVDAALNQGEADFIPGLTNGLIGLLDYLLPHLAISPPDHFADTGKMLGSEVNHA